MRVYDISQEVFGCKVYPGDPAPEGKRVAKMEEGSAYNLTAFSMCAHNGTHVDAPFHFFADGRTVESISLEKCVGYALVASVRGSLSATAAEELWRRAKETSPDGAARLLLKGKVTVTNEAAETLARLGTALVGVESQTVGPEDAPLAAHLVLLGAETVLLEGVRLAAVPDGNYLLCAAPLALGGADGAPCRAVLICMDGMDQNAFV